MPDNNVDIEINVLETGIESVSKVNTNMGALNTSLSKQVPIMRELNPLLGTMGLGFLGSATAIGALVTGATMLNSVYESWLKSSVNYALASNQLTKSTVSYSDAIEVSKKLSDEYLVSQQKIQDNFPTLEAVTGDFSTAVGFMADALKLSTKHGVDLEKVTKDLAAAYVGGVTIKGIAYPGGQTGYAAQKSVYEGMGSTADTIPQTIDMAYKKTMDDKLRPLGLFANYLKQAYQLVSLETMDNPAFLKTIQGFKSPSKPSTEAPTTIHNHIYLDGQQIADNVTQHQETANNLRGATGQ